ncbi:hypothetical protein IFM89_036971 [Coptis chinensis]|uniref:Ankyrin repeat domain-containing protein n=1 Tax=Coptis chinensis TaxID=261450 RepID=A0A835HB89_9MAGN|nr:hypothetical protein IFM89_036971 [Coptis chinensis]
MPENGISYWFIAHRHSCYEQRYIYMQWKAKLYDMQNVVVSIKSRRVAITDDEFFSSCNETESDYGDLLTEDEKSQLELALKIDSSESVPENGISDGFIAHRHSVYLVDGENRKPSPRHKKICFLLEVHFVWRRRLPCGKLKLLEMRILLMYLSATFLNGNVLKGWAGSLVKPALFDVVLAVIVVTTSSLQLLLNCLH